MENTNTPAAPVTPAPLRTVTVPPENRPSRLAFFGQFIVWVFTLGGLLRKNTNSQSETLFVLDRAFFLWAMAVVGFVGSFFTRHWPSTATFFGWVLGLTFLYTIVLLVRQLNTKKAILWGIVILCAYLLIRYPLAWLGIVPGLSHYIGNRHPVLNADLSLLFAWSSLVLVVSALYDTFANGQKRITPNSIEEWHFLTGSEVFDRGGLRFRTTYPDILESILGFGAGDLIAYDRSNRVQKRYENVFGLFFKWRRLDHILHERYAVVDNLDAGHSGTTDFHSDADHAVVDAGTL